MNKLNNDFSFIRTYLIYCFSLNLYKIKQLMKSTFKKDELGNSPNVVIDLLGFYILFVDPVKQYFLCFIYL